MRTNHLHTNMFVVELEDQEFVFLTELAQASQKPFAYILELWIRSGYHTTCLINSEPNASCEQR